MTVGLGRERFSRFLTALSIGLSLHLLACSSDGRLEVRNQPSRDPGSTLPTAAADAPLASPGATGPTGGTPDPNLVRQVEEQVSAKNATEPKGLDALSPDGWVAVVGVAAPDAELLTLSPTYAKSHTDLLLTQLLSTTPQADMSPMVETIAVENAGELRLAAVAALGRMHATDTLVRLITRFQDDSEARLNAAPLLMPSELDDATAAAVAHLLDSPILGAIEKQQIAFNLAAVGRRDGPTQPDAVTADLSPEALARIAAMRALLQN